MKRKKKRKRSKKILVKKRLNSSLNGGRKGEVVKNILKSLGF